MKNIAILAFEDCFQSSVTGPLDILTVASLEWKRLVLDDSINFFNLKILTDDGLPVTCSNGMKIEPHMRKDECDNLDIIIIPVIYGDLECTLTNRKLIGWLYDQNKNGAIICAVCAGVFLVAETGLLDRKKATTHWQLADNFQKRYPHVLLKKEKMIVDEGDVITAGGVTSYMDLSIYLAGRFGSFELASSVSKLLLIDPSRNLQTPYTIFNFNSAHGDENILKTQQWMEDNITTFMTVSDLAKKANLGERTFARRFKKATGDTPLEYLQHLRIGQARTFLETTEESIDTITYATGYEDVSSFRRLFKKITGISPSSYRKRFSLYR
jgi:transcriptional regulator GlxA family with amidase domain